METVKKVLGLCFVSILLTSCAASPTSQTASETSSVASSDCDPKYCVEIGIGEPIYLGSMALVSDSLGADARAVVKLGVDALDGQFNGINGQLLGHDIELIEFDEDCTKESGIEGAELFLQQPSILAVIGPTCSASAFEGAAKVLSAAHVLTISPSNTSPLLTGVKSDTQYYFRTATNDLIQAAVAADFTMDKFRDPSVAVITFNTAYSLPMSESYIARLAAAGITEAKQHDIQDDLGDLTQIISKISVDKPTLIFLPMFEEECEEVISAIRGTPELERTAILVADSCQTRRVANSIAAGESALYAASPDIPILESNAFYSEEFLPAYNRLVGPGTPGVYSPSAFDAVNLALAAISEGAEKLPGGALRVDRRVARDAMLNVQNYQGISNQLSCTPLGDCVLSARVSIYSMPAWPSIDPSAKPVFSKTIGLAELTR